MIDQVRPADLAAWIQSRADSAPAVVLDVREPWELQTASVKAEGFELVAIPMNEIPARMADLDAARPLAILCHTGRRSQRVAMFLESNGFTTLANIAGGIEAWASERDPAVPRY
ncbi:MAG: rhodanese-like domain-containing protein [Ramlibacter sp.]